MDPMLEDLARARISARLQDAEGLRPGRRHTAAARLGRKADEAGRRAALAQGR
jgi:hypothetical protein